MGKIMEQKDLGLVQQKAGLQRFKELPGAGEGRHEHLPEKLEKQKEAEEEKQEPD